MKKLTTGRWLVRHGLVLVVFIAFINLGLWQLRRLEERRALNNEILAGLSQPSMVLDGADVAPDRLHFHRVSATGTFDNAASVLLRNQPFNGQPGAHLITPLKIKGSERAVLVDRGWIPLVEAGPDNWRVYDVSGEVTVNGIARRSQPRPDGFLVPTDPTPGPGQTRLTAWFRVDIDRIQQQVPYPLLPIFIEQSPDPAVGTNRPPLPAGDPVLDEGPHLNYAIQWFTFALILLITYAAFLRQQLKEKG